MAKQARKLIANNKKVYHDYFLEETFEAGIALAGTEVKSMRMGKCSIKESFIHIENGEVILYGMHISPYEKGNIFNKDPLRVRKLLLHKKEILKIRLISKAIRTARRQRKTNRCMLKERRSAKPLPSAVPNAALPKKAVFSDSRKVYKQQTPKNVAFQSLLTKKNGV